MKKKNHFWEKTAELVKPRQSKVFLTFILLGLLVFLGFSTFIGILSYLNLDYLFDIIAFPLYLFKPFVNLMIHLNIRPPPNARVLISWIILSLILFITLYYYLIACLIVFAYKKIASSKQKSNSLIKVLLVFLLAIIMVRALMKPGFPNDFSIVTMTLQRGACYGTCPDYDITIYGNGTVKWNGHRFVDSIGERESKISREQVYELVKGFYDSGYFFMRDHYTSSMTDGPSTTTSITIGPRTKSIYNYLSGPRRLYELEDRIDMIVDSKQWIAEPNGCINRCGAQFKNWEEGVRYSECKTEESTRIKGKFVETYGSACCCTNSFSNLAECNNISNSSYKDECIKSAALLKNNSDYCSGIVSSDEKDMCFFMIANDNLNHNYCQNISDINQKDSCNSQIAKKTIKIEPCLLVANSSEKDECIISVAQNSRKKEFCLYSSSVESCEYIFYQENCDMLNQDINIESYDNESFFVFKVINKITNQPYRCKEIMFDRKECIFKFNNNDYTACPLRITKVRLFIKTDSNGFALANKSKFNLSDEKDAPLDKYYAHSRYTGNQTNYENSSVWNVAIGYFELKNYDLKTIVITE